MVGCITLHIFAQQEHDNNDEKRLIVECTNQASTIPETEYYVLFLPSQSEDGNLQLFLWSEHSSNLQDSVWNFWAENVAQTYKQLQKFTEMVMFQRSLNVR